MFTFKLSSAIWRFFLFSFFAKKFKILIFLKKKVSFQNLLGLAVHKIFAKPNTPFEEVVNSKSNAAQVFVRCVRVYSLHEKLWKKRKKLIWWGSENSHHSSLVRLRFELLVLTLNHRLNGNYSLGNFRPT